TTTTRKEKAACKDSQDVKEKDPAISQPTKDVKQVAKPPEALGKGDNDTHSFKSTDSEGSGKPLVGDGKEARR
ncbi:MAG: hypothetical protein Q9191_008538, partial [Dirinaria sp. TL-2023a]